MKLLKNFCFICVLFVLSGFALLSCKEINVIDEPQESIVGKLSKDENLKGYLIKNFQMQRNLYSQMKGMTEKEALSFIAEIQKKADIKNESDALEFGDLLGYSDVNSLKADISYLQDLSSRINNSCFNLTGNKGSANSQIIGQAMQKLVLDNQKKSRQSGYENALIPPVPEEYSQGECSDTQGYNGCIYVAMGDGTVTGLGCYGLVAVPWLAIACGAANFANTLYKYRVCYRTFCKPPDPKPILAPLPLNE